MDKVKTWLAAPGRIRMLTVLYILAVVALKAAGLDSLVSYLGFAAPLLPTDSPVSPVDATAALLGAVAVIKAFAKWLRPAKAVK